MEKVEKSETLLPPLLSKRLPPILLQAGERELLRDQIIAFGVFMKRHGLSHSRDGSKHRQHVELEIFHDMCHGFQLLMFCHQTPRKAMDTVVEFVRRTSG